jgi:ferritin
MLKKPVLKKLNDQLNSELYSSYLYYAMTGYFESVNLKGFANWMQIQAQEELTHTHRIFTYINDKGERAEFGPHDAPQQNWKSPLECMQAAYDHECLISEQINECVTLALKENDHSTNTMLQWFVAEQVEEEATADDIVQKLKLIADHPSGLYMLDNELAGRTFQGADDPGA